MDTLSLVLELNRAAVEAAAMDEGVQAQIRAIRGKRHVHPSDLEEALKNLSWSLSVQSLTATSVMSWAVDQELRAQALEARLAAMEAKGHEETGGG